GGWSRRGGRRRSVSAPCRPACRPAASARGRASTRAPPGGAGSLQPCPLSAEFLELRLVGGELLALGIDHVRGSLGDEPLVGELPLAALHLGAQPLAPLLDSPSDDLRIDALGLQQLDPADAGAGLPSVLRELNAA